MRITLEGLMSYSEMPFPVRIMIRERVKEQVEDMTGDFHDPSALRHVFRMRLCLEDDYGE